MKKIVALLLVAVLALGMSTVAFAKITGVKDDARWTWSNKDPNALTPGDIVYWAMPASNFTWDDAGPSTSGVTKSEISKGKVSLRARVVKGSSMIEEYKIEQDRGVSRVKLEIVDPFKSIKDIDYEIELYFVVDGTSYRDQYMSAIGNIENKTISIYADDDYMTSQDGVILEAEEYNKGLEVDLGCGVSVFMKAFKGAKYWGVADTEPRTADDALLDKYKIDNIIYLDTINMQNVTSHVLLNDQDSSYYVYTTDDVDALAAADGELRYLGKSNEKLPFASKYLLSSKMLDVDVDEEEPEDEEIEEAPEAGPETGGDGYPENVNDNPGTGK